MPITIQTISQIEAIPMERARKAVWAYATDTVWGLGAWVFDAQAHQAVTDIKGTLEGKPLSLLFTDRAAWEGAASWPPLVRGERAGRLFELEASLAAPKTWFTQTYPAHAVGTGPYVSTRCLAFPLLSALGKQLQGPVTTTSLNITGHAPVQNTEEARALLTARVPPGVEVFLLDDKAVRPSGQASSMLVLKDNGEWDFWREGRHVDKIRAFMAQAP